jgi:hypothetical protein
MKPGDIIPPSKRPCAVCAAEVIIPAMSVAKMPWDILCETCERAGKISKPNPEMFIKTEPSELTGIAFYLCLQYKEHLFQEMLPTDFMGMNESMQTLASQPVAERLRKQLAPILQAEDAPKIYLG